MVNTWKHEGRECTPATFLSFVITPWNSEKNAKQETIFHLIAAVVFLKPASLLVYKLLLSLSMCSIQRIQITDTHSYENGGNR